jgi:carbonic anhydrase
MKTFTLILIATILFSCSGPTSKKAGGSESASDSAITTEMQTKLTPDSVITLLKEGNRRFYTFTPRRFNDRRRIKETAKGQAPMAAVLSCIDSRVPVETVVNMGIGDLFVARVAGNIENEDMLGSLEYACGVMKAKVILVLGHEECGAVKSAIDSVEMGNITALLARIQPAVGATHTPGERDSHNKQFVHDVAIKNIEFTVNKMRKDSHIIDSLVQHNEIKILRGMYDLKNGRITFF